MNLRTIKKTNRKCPVRVNKGAIFEIGFFSRTDFVKLYETCADPNTAYVYYAVHTIHGSSIDKQMPKGKEGDWDTWGVNKKMAIDVAYAYKNQNQSFLKLLGETAAEKFYNNYTGLCFNRGHLNPSGDQLFSSWKKATFFLLNTIPQWKKVNGGNYEKLERHIKKQASRLGRDLKAITGGFDDLKFARKTITLNKEGIRVPKWIWKVLIDESTQDMIAFVTLNDPHLDEPPNSQYLLCPDVCIKHKWYIENRVDQSQGYTFCCTVSELKKAIPYIPVEYSGRDMNYSNVNS